MDGELTVVRPQRWILVCRSAPSDLWAWECIIFDKPVDGEPERHQLPEGARWCFYDSGMRHRGDGTIDIKEARGEVQIYTIQ
jgi:hypothetical protein